MYSAIDSKANECFIVLQWISFQEVGGCAVELHIRREAADLPAAEGGEHRASLSLSLLFPLSLDQLIRTQLTHLYGTVVRRRARTTVPPQLQIVRLRGRRAGGHLRRLGPAGVRRAGCVDGIRGAREGLDDDECVSAGACDCDCG